MKSNILLKRILQRNQERPYSQRRIKPQKPLQLKNETKNTISGYALIKQLKSMGKIRKSPLAGLN